MANSRVTVQSLPTNAAVVRGPGGDHLPAYMAKGVVGMRVLNPPLRGGVATLSGWPMCIRWAEVEGTGRAPFPLAGDLGGGRRPTERLPRPGEGGRAALRLCLW
jgi:hypothetical protein